MSLDFQKLQDLIMAIAQTDITSLELVADDFELKVSKQKETVVLSAPTVASEAIASLPPTVMSVPAVQPVAPAPVVEEVPPPSRDKKWVEITSPMVGTFYRAPGPGEAPFAEVGDRIGVGHTVAIIEAMKLMNEIEAEVAGEVMEIAVQNGEPVEYGQTLMWVNPS